MQTNRRVDPHDDRGAQAMELAAVIPLILLLSLILIGLAQGAAGALVAHRQAAAGARLAAVDDDAAVRRLLEGDPSITAISVDPTGIARQVGDPVQVTVSRRVQLVLLGGVDIAGRATFLTEDVP